MMVEMLKRTVAILMLLAFVHPGVAQQNGQNKKEYEYARSFTLTDNQTDSLIVVYRDGSKCSLLRKDLTKVTDSSYYPLVKNALLPTADSTTSIKPYKMKNSGDMWYDGEIIPFDNTTFSMISNRKAYSEVKPLEAELICRRTVHRFKDTLQNEPKYAKYRDSVWFDMDSTFIVVHGDSSGDTVPYSIVLTDLSTMKVRVIEDANFQSDRAVFLDESLKNLIGLEVLNDKDLKSMNLKNDMSFDRPVERIQINPEGHVISFVKNIHYDIKVAREDMPLASQPWYNNKWIILAGALVLLGLFIWLVIHLLLSKKRHHPKGNKMSFDLNTIADEDEIDAIVSKLYDKADESMEFTNDDGVISFVVNKNNAPLFMIPEVEDQSEETFYQSLKEFIQNSHNKQGRKELQKKLDVIESYFSTEGGKGVPVDDVVEQPENVDEQPENNELKKKNLELGKQIAILNKELDSAQKKLKGKEKELEGKEKELEGVEKQRKYLDSIVQNIKNNPQSFKGNREFRKLSQLIEDASNSNELRKTLNENPNEIDPNSTTGILIRKGLFLDQAKDNVHLITQGNQLLGDCKLKSLLGFISNPQSIGNDPQWKDTSLYKLVNDTQYLMNCANANKAVDLKNCTSDQIRQRLAVVIDGYNQFLKMNALAKQRGSGNYDTSTLSSEVKKIYDDAKKYLDFGQYENYWKNIVPPVSNVLDQLHLHDDHYNMRALLFYTSQLYAIACIMNSIHGNALYSTKRPQINVDLFNGSTPVMGEYGFPQLDSSVLKQYMFEYTGNSEEDQKLDYLSKFAPLPFLLKSSYYPENS